MNVKDTFENQMACSTCFFKNPLPWIAVLVPVIVSACFLGFGFLPILITTSFLIIISSIFFTSRHKTVPDEMERTSVKEDESLTLDQKCSPDQVEEIESEELEIESETITQPQQIKKVQESEVGQTQTHDCIVVGTVLDSFSESESIDDDQYSSTTDQDSEADWSYSGNVGQSPDCSDDSISDEESLIEIALPSGHYVGFEKEDSISKCDLGQKFPDLSPQPELIFKQHSLMERLAEGNEMNEEDNLIEIDISMGSIKCSRFEIEA